MALFNCQEVAMPEHNIWNRATSEVSPAHSLANHPHRILVAEDDMVLRQLSARLLSRSGYRVLAAEDGAAAWDALHDNTFDLLITDHDMPKLTGLELVRKVRGAHMSLPVILASGTFDLDEWVKDPCLQLAAMLPKPFTFDQLLVTVKNVLHHSSVAQKSK
jgi:DNA-binding NtrC family response regulator